MIFTGITDFKELIKSDEDIGLADFLKKTDCRDTLLEPALELPLTSQQLDIVSPIADQYIIPRNQRRCKKQALIYYCDRDRVGAEEEAERVEKALAKVGFNTMKETWESFWGFRKTLRDKVQYFHSPNIVDFVGWVEIVSHPIKSSEFVVYPTKTWLFVAEL